MNSGQISIRAALGQGRSRSRGARAKLQRARYLYHGPGERGQERPRRVAPPGVVLPANQYGKLPALNSLDGLAPRRTTTFKAVGYGLQKVNDGSNHNLMQLIALKTRMQADPFLLQINTGFTGPQSLMLSNNAATGGTCFGDSGGPNFLGDSLVVAGVTSFGMNGSCGGTGGVFRTDRQDVLDFINAHIAE